ncbi:MAG: DMT family transporter [Panacagrimonas sp.]
MSQTPNAPAASSDTLGGLTFVVLWSTGYISAGFALQGSGPITLSVLRFAGTALIIGLWLLVQRAPRPLKRDLIHACIGGVLLQGGFFGFVYTAMHMGVPASTGGLVAGLMPLTTALGGALLLGERMRWPAVMGLGLGLIGVLLVIGPELRAPDNVPGYVCMLLALLALSLGTLYQKRHAGNLDARLAPVAQVTAAMLVLLPLAWWSEGLSLHLSPAAIGGTLWIIVVNSCSGLLLYLWLLKRGAAGRVASLFFLVPPVTAVLAAAVLGVHFSLQDAAGFGLAAAGVWMGQRG